MVISINPLLTKCPWNRGKTTRSLLCIKRMCYTAQDTRHYMVDWITSFQMHQNLLHGNMSSLKQYVAYGEKQGYPNGSELKAFCREVLLMRCCHVRSSFEAQRLNSPACADLSHIQRKEKLEIFFFNTFTYFIDQREGLFGKRKWNNKAFLLIVEFHRFVVFFKDILNTNHS